MTWLHYLGHSMVQHFKRLRACSADCLVNSRESSVSYSGSVTERALFSPDILVAILYCTARPQVVTAQEAALLHIVVWCRVSGPVQYLPTFPSSITTLLGIPTHNSSPYSRGSQGLLWVYRQSHNPPRYRSHPHHPWQADPRPDM